MATGSRNSSMSPASGIRVGFEMWMRLALAGDDLVGDVGGGLDQGEVALALQSLLDNLHVEHAQEPATEAEPERVGGLGLEGEAGIVECQLLQGRAEVLELIVRGREQAAEDDLHRLLVARQRYRRAAGHLGDRVADP